MNAFSLIETDMAHRGAELRMIRRAVFIVEQGVPEALEWDAHDAVSAHWLAVLADGSPVGCARLLPDGHIGRMAVLPAWRRQGIGRALLDAALTRARSHGMHRVQLSAQTHATGFYLRAGFIPVGEVYEEAGIPHIAMHKFFP